MRDVDNKQREFFDISAWGREGHTSVPTIRQAEELPISDKVDVDEYHGVAFSASNGCWGLLMSKGVFYGKTFDRYKERHSEYEKEIHPENSKVLSDVETGFEWPVNIPTGNIKNFTMNIESLIINEETLQ